MFDFRDKTFGLISHPFWTEVLSITESELKKDSVFAFSKANAEVKAKFLQLIVNGFYPLGNISYLVFKRVETATNSEAADIVKPIYEAEAGMRPLVKGTRFESVTHPAQFKLFIESMMPDLKLIAPIELKDKLVLDSSIKEATVSEAIAAAYIIENSAPGIIYALQDFACKWQVFNTRRSKFIEYNFVYEHGLIEGSEAAEQHLCIIEALLNKFKDRIDFDQFETMAQKFVRTYHQLLDGVMLELAELKNA